MVDVTIASGDVNTSDQYLRSYTFGPVWTTKLIGYFFYLSNDATQTLRYRKTTDGGATWSSTTVMYTPTGNNNTFSIWYDQWTPGDSGTKIHIAIAVNSGDSVRYLSLDTSSDTVSSDIQIAAINQGGAGSPTSIAKMRGGNLVVGNISITLDSGSWRSTDGGTTWGSIANLTDGTDEDHFIILPGNETDNQDAWIIYWDDSASEISLKVYDDSLNSVSETSIATSVDWNGFPTLIHFGMQAAIRKSDNHALLAIWSAPTGTQSLRVWDINGSASITEKTAVLSSVSGYREVHITVAQGSGDIYVGYSDKSDIFYKISTDGATSWGGEVQYNVTTATSVRGLSGDIAPSTGRFELSWFDNSPDTWFTNFDNSIAVGISQLNAVSDFFVGTSSDTKPTGLGGTALFKETDTGDAYYWNGSSWLLFSGPT